MAITTDNSIQALISGFNGGLRPNRFYLNGAFPPSVSNGQGSQFETHIRSASIPASDLGQIAVPYRGREFKIPGNRTYATWQITVLDDSNLLWKKFHQWSNLINSNPTNEPSGTAGVTDFTNLMENWEIVQLDVNGNCVRKNKLIGCWPSIVGELSLSMDENESLSTFTVDVEYQYQTSGYACATPPGNPLTDNPKPEDVPDLIKG